MKKFLILSFLSLFLALNSYANPPKKITLISKEEPMIFSQSHSVDVDSAVNKAILEAIEKKVQVQVLDASRDDFEYLVFYQIDDFSGKDTDAGTNVSADVTVKIFKNDSTELYSKNIKFAYKTFMSKPSDIFQSALNRVKDEIVKDISEATFK